MQYKTYAVLAAMIFLTSCAATKVAGDAGCASYGEARLSIPADADALPDAWLRWVVMTDTRMTEVCRL